MSVSYTHLDVYKRQAKSFSCIANRGFPLLKYSSKLNFTWKSHQPLAQPLTGRARDHLVYYYCLLYTSKMCIRDSI